MCSSNLEMLKSLLLTCPDCSNDEIIEICKLKNNKNLVNELVNLYIFEASDNSKLNKIVKPDIDLKDNEYYVKLYYCLNEINKEVELQNLLFKNYELVENIYKRVSDLINLNLQSEQNNKQEIKIENPIDKLKNNKSIDNIVDVLVFEIRDIEFFKELFQNHFVDFNNHFQDEYNIRKLIEKYIEFAKDELTEDYALLSMSKIITYIVNNKLLNITKKEREAYLNIVNKTINKLNRSKYGKNERKRIIRALNILVNSIKNTTFNNVSKFRANINDKYGIAQQFSKEALLELKKLKKVDNKIYIDLSSKTILTIDCNKNVCCEDAISVEKLENGNYLLGIYITDVYSYINELSVLELEAYNRAKTIYLPGGPITMFPEQLVYNQFSLKANSPKYVIANLFELSPSFELVNYEIKRAIINVKGNLSFKSYDRRIENSKNKDEITMHSMLIDIQNHIKNINPIVNKYYNKPSEDISSEDIISTFMIYLNSNSKLAYDELGLPCIYKIYNMNKYVKQPTPKGIGLQKAVIKMLEEPSSRSFYATTHKGLTSNNFSISMPVTVPVRNYGALQNQKLIQKFFIDKEKILNKDIYKLEEQLKIISAHLNEKDKIIKEYKEEYCHGIKEYKKRR